MEEANQYSQEEYELQSQYEAEDLPVFPLFHDFDFFLPAPQTLPAFYGPGTVVLTDEELEAEMDIDMSLDADQELDPLSDFPCDTLRCDNSETKFFHAYQKHYDFFEMTEIIPQICSRCDHCSTQSENNFSFCYCCKKSVCSGCFDENFEICYSCVTSLKICSNSECSRAYFDHTKLRSCNICQNTICVECVVCDCFFE